MNDAQFITQFENQTLNPEVFNHLGHLKIAWLYLDQNELKTAIGKVNSGIAKYAASLGAADKFHHTLTQATVMIMAARRLQSVTRGFKEFIENNRDLVDDLPKILAEHYSKTLLDSSKAKNEYLEPDIKPFQQL